MIVQVVHCTRVFTKEGSGAEVWLMLCYQTTHPGTRLSEGGGNIFLIHTKITVCPQTCADPLKRGVPFSTLQRQLMDQ